jgi:Amt family ammonium transporter
MVAAEFSILLIPLALVGLALINAGLARSRNTAHILMASLCAVAIAALAYFVFGFSWEGVAGAPGHAISLRGKDWNWIGASKLFWGGLVLDGSPSSLAACMQLFAVGFAAMIPVGGAAERWRLSAVCASTALFAGITYPLFAHAVWAGGWLAQLGANYGVGSGFADAGGSSAIQASGGLTALALAWILGPRRGKYSAEGLPLALPGHNVGLVFLGCFLMWTGWLGLNSAGAILFSGINPAPVVLVLVNTTLAATSGALSAAALTRFRFGKPDASLTANGWVGGLVASSAACAFVPPAAAMLIGIVAGLLIPLAIENLEMRLGIDDPCGAISVHALGGIWGIISVGIFGRLPEGQWIAQMAGVATLLGFVLPLSYGLNWLLNRVLPQRVSPEAERQGLDLHELGAGAYPEFMTHGDEFLQG